jgi:hypothetical protein
MSPVCLDLAVLDARPHNGQTQSGGFCPDATIARTFPFAAAYPPGSVWLHPVTVTATYSAIPQDPTTLTVGAADATARDASRSRG